MSLLHSVSPQVSPAKVTTGAGSPVTLQVSSTGIPPLWNSALSSGWTVNTRGTTTMKETTGT